MKTMRSLLNSLIVCGVALATVSALAADTTVEGAAKVVRIKGSARYQVGAGAPWQTLKRGDQLSAGTIIETGMDSRVDLVLGEGTPPVARPVVGEVLTYQPVAEQNMVRVWENSRLGLVKLTRTDTGANPVTETKLDLQAGHIFGIVKKMSAASTYEVMIPSGVAGIRGTVYDISAEGVIKVLEGSIYLAYKDPSGNDKTQVIMTLQEFDARTGVLQPLSSIDKTGMLRVLGQMRAVSTMPLVYTRDSTIIYVSPH